MNELIAKSTSPYLTNEEILNNIQLYRSTGDIRYAHKIIFNFIKLLIKKARQYKKPLISIGDLIHYGLDGLIEAIERAFNLNAEEKFITYITIIIERRMKDGLDFQRGAVVFPKNIMTQQRKNMYSFVGSELNFTANDELPYSNEDNSNFIIYSKINISTDIDDLKSILDENNEIDNSIEDYIDKQSLQFDIFYILETILTTVERDVIVHHFGLNGENAKAFDTIGSILNISAQKIRKIRNSAVNKIKDNPKAVSILSKYFI